MRRRWVLIVAAACVLLVGVAVAVALVLDRTASAAPECRVPGHHGHADLDLDAVQLQHASTINAVGLARGLPERARVIALATAWQESSMRNLDGGDRDSLGLFQQRPSQGWGTREQIGDPVYAAGKFYDALVEVDDWRTRPLTEVAQAVQRSAYPDAYAKWEDEADTLAAALGGGEPPDLACRAGAQPSTAPAPRRPAVDGSDGLSTGLRDLLAAANAELGAITVRSAPDDRTAVVAVAVDGMTPQRAARALTAWTVAHATGFAVAQVTGPDGVYRDNGWTGSGTGTGQVRITAG